jgi:hypothetical protein
LIIIAQLEFYDFKVIALKITAVYSLFIHLFIQPIYAVYFAGALIFLPLRDVFSTISTCFGGGDGLSLTSQVVA